MTIHANSVACADADEYGIVSTNPVLVLATVSTDASSESTTITIRASRLVTNSRLELGRVDIGPVTVVGGVPLTVYKTLPLSNGYVTFDASATSGQNHSNTVTSNINVV